MLVGAVLQFSEQNGAGAAQFPVLGWHDVAYRVEASFPWERVEDVIDSGRESVVDADHFLIDVEHSSGVGWFFGKRVNKTEMATLSKPSGRV